jgi:hypothetical protein
MSAPGSVLPHPEAWQPSRLPALVPPGTLPRQRDAHAQALRRLSGDARERAGAKLAGMGCQGGPVSSSPW